MDSFETLLANAIKRCEKLHVEMFEKDFSLLYPFTTENISGYINLFNLDKLLTVGSSGDQVLNAIMGGARTIDVLDVNPYTKYYYYLKVACLLELELSEFLSFLRYKDYFKVFKDNRDAFSLPLYHKVKGTLRLLDYESYLFWDELLQNFSPLTVRKDLFYFDENRTQVIRNCNSYLMNEDAYLKLKKRVLNVVPRFIHGNVFSCSLEDQYTAIWLSNIGTYFSRHFVKKMTDQMSKYLLDDGKLLISYLYQTTKDTQYQEGWQLIYDLEKTFQILEDYQEHLSLVSFLGVVGLKFQDESKKDSVLIYQKSKAKE
ncbi:MAG TPA: DUF3419 family protein [Candidatus Scybalousia intestinigallinarum]|nr:DUF3419 family protein [Candidatus Scybalousia intestinigallinarum]